MPWTVPSLQTEGAYSPRHVSFNQNGLNGLTFTNRIVHMLFNPEQRSHCHTKLTVNAEY